jgi:hypothetical protein
MRTVPYMFRCCGHCRHGGVQEGHTRPCRNLVCRGSWPTLIWIGFKLIHPRRRW